MRQIPKMRHEPVAGLDHFARDFGVAAFVRFVERAAAEQKKNVNSVSAGNANLIKMVFISDREWLATEMDLP